MQKFLTYALAFPLAFQLAHSQVNRITSEDLAGEITSIGASPTEFKDYLYGYKTLYLSSGFTIYGRYFTLGYMINRNVFEIETAIELKQIRLRFDTLRTRDGSTLDHIANLGEADSNVSMSIATVRSFRREKFKFLGALCEIDAGLNLKTWFSRNSREMADSTAAIQPSQTENSRNQIILGARGMEFSSGPSFKFKLSSGKENGESVFLLVANLDVNYFFSKKRPTLDFGLGIMLAPFSF